MAKRKAHPIDDVVVPRGDPNIYDQECPPLTGHYHLPNNPAMLRVEPGRLGRAAKLWIQPLGDRKYAVQGSREVQWIDLYGDEPCYCEDALLAGWVCKHILAALLYERHPKVVAAWGRLREQEEQRNAWAWNPFLE